MKNENNERTSQEVDLLKKIFGADYFDKVEIPIPTELLTFENEFQKIYDVECSDFAKMFYLKLRLEVLKSTVELSDFVPCGDDGLPLEEPINIGIGIAENAYKEAMEKYQKAKQAVIFEGWESCIPLSHAIKNDKGYKITIYKKIGWAILDLPVHLEDSMYYSSIELPKKPTYSDLAKATIDNPLKLK